MSFRGVEKCSGPYIRNNQEREGELEYLIKQREKCWATVTMAWVHFLIFMHMHTSSQQGETNAFKSGFTV